jgi:hypothetical protein
MSPAHLLRRDVLFRSAPRRGGQPVASAAVDGFTVPVADLDAAGATKETA